jgi:hypothetical protein
MNSGVLSDREAIAAALDRFEAAQAEVASLSFQALSAPDAARDLLDEPCLHFSIGAVKRDQAAQRRIAVRLTPVRPLPCVACGRTMKLPGGAGDVGDPLRGVR